MGKTKALRKNDLYWQDKLRKADNKFHQKLLSDHAALDLTRHDDAEKALVHADVAMEKRLDSMNEFRNQLKDQAAALLPRKEYESRHNDLARMIQGNTDAINESRGRSSGFNAGWGYLVGFLGLLSTLILLVLTLVK